MKMYAKVRQFNDAKALPVFFHPEQVRFWKGFVLEQWAKFRKAYPNIPLDDGSKSAIRTALDLKDSIGFDDAYKDAFVHLERCETSSAVLKMLEHVYLPAKGIKVEDSKWEFGPSEATYKAIFYLTEKRQIFFIGQTATTVRYIVTFGRVDRSNQWWLLSCKTASF